MSFEAKLNFALDLIFPKICQGCRLEGTYFCLACQKNILIPLGCCFVCKRPSLTSQTHSECRSPSYVLDGLLVAAEYANQGVRNLIWQMKYNYIKEISRVLGLVLADYLFGSGTNDYFSEALVTPVPLHKIRKRARGFNQAELIAKDCSTRTTIEYADLLVRTKKTKSQIELEKPQRFNNIKGAFSLNMNAKTISGCKIIIIDDVATTGATLNECAKILKKAGAGEVWGLVVARN